MIDSFVKALYQHPILSWLVTFIGIVILLAPALVAWKISKHKFPQWKITSTGIGFGFTVVPLSLWLYMQFFVGPVRSFIFGFLGLFMMMVHMAPFTKVSIPFLLEATDKTSGTWGSPVLKQAIVGGFIWATIYGAVGFAIDLIRKRMKSL